MTDREAQALREVGVTRVSRWTAIGLSLLLLATILSVAVSEPLAEQLTVQSDAGSMERSPFLTLFRSFGSRVVDSLGDLPARGPLATNRALQATIDDFEKRLEEQSFLGRWLLARIQWRLSLYLGVANEQAYVGRNHWLFYRPDVDYVIGPGFLEPRVLRSRERSGDLWQSPPHPDPIPALVDLHRQLQARQIRLMVMPTPVKPTVEPQQFATRGAAIEESLQNPSFEEFVRRLTSQGVEIVDPAPWLVEVRRQTGESQYLRTDTHWTPQAVDLVARKLADLLESGRDAARPLAGYRRRAVTLEALGDIAAMLLLPPGQTSIVPDRIMVAMVLRDDGRLWRPERGAEVLLLGDSFSNIFSDPTLGWGSAAGLAEQLSFHLQQPVDKLALNAGGAMATRQVLQRALASGEDRLASKRVVIYQFATRELSFGDWTPLTLAAEAP